MADPDLLETSLSFVIDLLPLSGHLPIFLLFDTLLTVATHSTPAAEFLRSHRFVQAVVARLAVTNDAENLYRLLIQCAVSWPLQDDCIAPGVLQFVINDDSPLAWRLRVTLLHRETIDDLVPALPRGIAILSHDPIEKVDEFRVAVVDFVAAVYDYDPERARVCNNEPMCRALAGWFDAFPDHSIALRTVCQFMKTAIEIGELRGYVLRWFMPLVIRADGTTRNQAAFAVDWARDVKALMAADAALEADLAGHGEFIEFCRTRVAHVDGLIDGRPPGLFPPIAAGVPSPSLGLDAPTVHA
jgi:hypothetical protein